MRGSMVRGLGIAGVVVLTLATWGLQAGLAAGAGAKPGVAAKPQPVEMMEINLSARLKPVDAAGRPRPIRIDGEQLVDLANGEMRLSGHARIELPERIILHLRSGSIRIVKDGQGRLTRMLIYSEVADPVGKGAR